MDDNKIYYNECANMDKGLEKMRDEVKMLEISEAIHDLDSKLTDLEIALHINGRKQ